MKLGQNFNTHLKLTLVSPPGLIVPLGRFSQQTGVAGHQWEGTSLSLPRSSHNWSSDGTAAPPHKWSLGKRRWCIRFFFLLVYPKGRDFNSLNILNGLFAEKNFWIVLMRPLTDGGACFRFVPVVWPSLPLSVRPLALDAQLLSLVLVLLGFDIQPCNIQHLQGAAHGLHLLFHWCALGTTCRSTMGNWRYFLLLSLRLKIFITFLKDKL